MIDPVMLVFAISAGLVVYVYAGYPLLIALIARLRPKPVRRGAVSLRCSVVISAYNEGPRVAAKVSAFKRLAGYASIDEVVIGLDGSTDGTAALLQALDEPKLRVMDFPTRRGKPAVVNDVVATVRSDILLFTDARQRLGDDAIFALLENFADPSVGVVSGELVFVPAGDATVATQGMTRYWSFEKWIRRNESAFRSVPGATGALYAMRRSLFRAMPEQTLLDDVLVPMQAIRIGSRCVFESRAIAFDHPSKTRAEETRRKRRTLAGNLQAIRLAPWLIHPGQNPIWWEFVSHKLGRLFVPWALLGMWIACFCGLASPVFRFLLLLQVCAYALAMAGGLISAANRRAGMWGIPWMFVVMNGVAMLAWWDLIRGRFDARWRTAGS